jgi:hypothetical protein
MIDSIKWLFHSGSCSVCGAENQSKSYSYKFLKTQQYIKTFYTLHNSPPHSMEIL